MEQPLIEINLDGIPFSEECAAEMNLWSKFITGIKRWNGEVVIEFFIPEKDFKESIIVNTLNDFRQSELESVYEEPVYASYGYLIRDKIRLGRRIVFYKST